jgi:hypothetical protein
MVDDAVGVKIKSGDDLTRQQKKNADADEHDANHEAESVGEQGKHTLIGYPNPIDAPNGI